jgi:hypothetical protein
MLHRLQKRPARNMPHSALKRKRSVIHDVKVFLILLLTLLASPINGGRWPRRKLGNGNLTLTCALSLQMTLNVRMRTVLRNGKQANLGRVTSRTPTPRRNRLVLTLCSCNGSVQTQNWCTIYSGMRQRRPNRAFSLRPSGDL